MGQEGRNDLNPLCRDELQEYWTVAPNGCPIKIEWGVMSRRQKELQLEAERRQREIDAFGLYS